jgi:hypothetical protein
VRSNRPADGSDDDQRPACRSSERGRSRLWPIPPNEAQSDAVAGATSRSSHDRYLDIRDLVSRRGREMADAFDDMRRSRAVLRIARIRALGILTAEEYSRFTDIIRDEVDRIAV